MILRNNKFSGFIVTYNRPKILFHTLEKVFSQSLPPEKLWIIDNSEGFETEKLIQTLVNLPLVYFRMGYNAGPAGASAKGLELVSQAGYEWIYWGDDNDPPFRSDCFERLLSIKDKIPNTGVIGSVGHFFNKASGIVIRTSNEKLMESSLLKVDFVAGGMCMLVNSEVVKKRILPDPKLFFGFEELDFCLRVKKANYEVVVDTTLFLEAREASGRLDFKKPKYIKKDALSREYYSLRNLLIISDTIASPKMKFHLLIRWSIKMIYGFRFGLSYGIQNFRNIFMAFFHYFIGKNGKTLNI